MKYLNLIVVVLFLSVIPLSFASFNCYLTSNINRCNQIINSNISENQKDQLLSSLLYNSTNYPDHEFIFNYNTKIKVNLSIENLTIINSTYIKNGWLSLLTVMPSVLEDNTLFVSSTTFVLSEYDYFIEVPKDYISKGYPKIKNGDCKTIHTLIENISTLNVLVNNENQGSLKLNPVNIKEDSIITDKLNIKSSIKQDHYHWKQYCISKKNGRCVKYEYRCEYFSTDYLKDEVNLEDSINVKYYNIKPLVNIKVLDYYNNVTKLQFNAKDFDSLTINFNNSYYSEQRYVYSLEFIKKPFYIAVLKAEKVDIKKNYGLVSGLNNTIFISSSFAQDFSKSLNCKLNSFNHFFNFSSGCNLNLVKEENDKYEVIPFSFDLVYFLKLFVLLFILYLICRIIKYYI